MIRVSVTCDKSCVSVTCEKSGVEKSNYGQ